MDKSTDREKKALQDEISYLSRLIDRHQQMSKPRGGAQVRSSNRYTKVNAREAQAGHIVSLSRSLLSTHNIGASSATRVGNSSSLCSCVTYNVRTVQRTPQHTLAAYNAPAVQRTPLQAPKRRSLSTVVHKSRYTLKKLHPGPTSAEKLMLKATAVLPNTLQSTMPVIGTSTPMSHHGTLRKSRTPGKYVYCRKNAVNVTEVLTTRAVLPPAGHTGRTPRQLLSTYKLIRNKSKAATPVKSPSNLACIGARRIVKKYKVNNVNRSRTSLQRPARSQYGNCATTSKVKRSWPPSYSTTHYFNGQKRKSPGKPSSNAAVSQAHYIKIGNITYKASRNKLSRTFKRSLSCSPVLRKASPRHERVLAVRGSVYMMDAAGKMLRRISQPQRNSEQRSGLTRIDIGGKTYIEQKPGVLSQTPSAGTRTYLNRTVNRSIHRVRNLDSSQKLKQKSYCMFFNRFGRCNKGDKCAYIHDPEKVAVCTRFLRGTCKVSDCPFSHKIAPEKMPVCSFFLKGCCTNDPCPYRHVKVNSRAAVCKDFAICGYCAEGIKCKKQHILICPEYAANKKCPRGNKCYLSHHVRGTKRKHEEDFSEGAPEDSSVPVVPLKAPKQSMSCAGPSSTTEDEHRSRKISQAPLFIPLESSRPHMATPASSPRKNLTGIRIRPNFLS